LVFIGYLHKNADEMNDEQLKISLCQIAPHWFSKKKTLQKVNEYLSKAAVDNCDLAVFGECLVPGYPFWLEYTNGAVFNSGIQKEFYSRYLKEAVDISGGDLDSVCTLAKKSRMAVYLGVLERAKDRGSHSVYCTLVYINEEGQICSTHRKLMPTYEERLVWGIGDGNGLQVHPLKGFHVGGLNCWENWMPLTRSAMYAQGENVHVAVWPGSARNTSDITRHIAKESRSFVVSVSGFMRKELIPDDIPQSVTIKKNAPDFMADGGSCISAPDGSWIIEPIIGKEAFASATVNLREVRKERQNFDPSGHYSRPDVMQLQVNRSRQKIVDFRENN
jgi:nitrilase